MYRLERTEGRLKVEPPSGLNVGQGLVAVNAVVTEEVFGEVLDKNLVHLRSEGLAAFDLREPLVPEPGRFGRIGSLAYLLLARTSLMKISATAVIGRI